MVVGVCVCGGGTAKNSLLCTFAVDLLSFLYLSFLICPIAVGGNLLGFYMLNYFFRHFVGPCYFDDVSRPYFVINLKIFFRSCH